LNVGGADWRRVLTNCLEDEEGLEAEVCSWECNSSSRDMIYFLIKEKKKKKRI